VRSGAPLEVKSRPLVITKAYGSYIRAVRLWTLIVPVSAQWLGAQVWLLKERIILNLGMTN